MSAASEQLIFVIPRDEAARIACDLDLEVAEAMDRLIEQYVDVEATAEVGGALHIVARDSHAACRLQKILDSLQIEYVPMLQTRDEDSDRPQLTEEQVQSIISSENVVAFPAPAPSQADLFDESGRAMIQACLAESQRDPGVAYVIRDQIFRMQQDALRLTHGVNDVNVVLLERFDQMNQKLV